MFIYVFFSPLIEYLFQLIGGFYDLYGRVHKRPRELVTLSVNKFDCSGMYVFIPPFK